MPSIHVVLDCASPTREPDRQFHTLVHVTDDELAAGDHLRRAARHAAIRGFPGPHRVVAAWNAVTGSAIGSDGRARELEASTDPRRLRERLEAAVDDAADVPTTVARVNSRTRLDERFSVTLIRRGPLSVFPWSVVRDGWTATDSSAEPSRQQSRRTDSARR